MTEKLRDKMRGWLFPEISDYSTLCGLYEYEQQIDQIKRDIVVLSSMMQTDRSFQWNTWSHIKEIKEEISAIKKHLLKDKTND